MVYRITCRNQKAAAKESVDPRVNRSLIKCQVTGIFERIGTTIFYFPKFPFDKLVFCLSGDAVLNSSDVL